MKCCIKNCGFYKNKLATSLHRFPKNESGKKFELWTKFARKAMNDPLFQPNYNRRICRNHFDIGDKEVDRKMICNQDFVPTITYEQYIERKTEEKLKRETDVTVVAIVSVPKYVEMGYESFERKQNLTSELPEHIEDKEIRENNIATITILPLNDEFEAVNTLTEDMQVVPTIDAITENGDNVLKINTNRIENDQLIIRDDNISQVRHDESLITVGKSDDLIYQNTQSDYKFLNNTDQHTQIDRASLIDQGTQIDRASLIDQGTQLDRSSLIDQGTQLDRSSLIDQGTQIDRASLIDQGTQLDRASLIDQGTQLDRSSLIDQGTQIDRASLIDQGTQIDRASLIDQGTQLDRSSLIDQGTQIDRASLIDQGTQLDRASLIDQGTQIDKTLLNNTDQNTQVNNEEFVDENEKTARPSYVERGIQCLEPFIRQIPVADPGTTSILTDPQTIQLKEQNELLERQIRQLDGVFERHRMRYQTRQLEAQNALLVRHCEEIQRMRNQTRQLEAQNAVLERRLLGYQTRQLEAENAVFERHRLRYQTGQLEAQNTMLERHLKLCKREFKHYEREIVKLKTENQKLKKSNEI